MIESEIDRQRQHVLCSLVYQINGKQMALLYCHCIHFLIQFVVDGVRLYMGLMWCAYTQFRTACMRLIWITIYNKNVHVTD